jgi:3-deoxy-D-manno-octulosonate 8-phosphate phosphatase (KDO 8-P phosphatase)
VSVRRRLFIRASGKVSGSIRYGQLEVEAGGQISGDIQAQGDDVVDLPVMLKVGLAVAVPEAPSLVRQHAHYVTGASGGAGAVRELCERVMQAQDTFDAIMARYLA